MPMDRRSFVAAAAAVASSIDPALAAGAAPDPVRDPLGVRDDFPVAAERTYLNSAYIAPVHRAVIAASRAYMEEKSKGSLEVGGLISATDAVRAQFARLVNATPDEIGLLFSTGDGENVIANGVGLRAGDNVVVDDLHYSTEFVLYRALEASRGIELRIVKNRDGAVTAADFEPHIDRRTRIVSVAWVSNQNGFRHDMRPIADLAHAHGAIFYADAVQAAGMIDLDVRAAGVDALCSGSYKWLMSEFGVAPFFVSRDAVDRLQSDRIGEFSVEREEPGWHYELVKNARKFEGTSRSFGAVAQLQASLSYLEKVGSTRIEEHTVALAQQIHQGLVKQGYRMFTPPGNRSSIVTFFFSRPADDFRAAFRTAKIDVTVRAAQVRVAPALFNNADEIERFLDVTKRLV
ncbi:MAG: aminotransferase class V-fold PLP-dependent enzyme [Acidobacteriia bacterium]|nr:aminotransferase class V-fold PLP-dependent enzyme [Terriglobia bacterium]